MIEVAEKYSARKILGGDNPGFQTAYFILGTDDEAAAMAKLLEPGVIPLTWGNAPRQNPNLEQVSDLIFEAAVQWSFQQITPPTEGEAATRFSTKGGRSKIMQSRGTRRYPKTGQTAPDFKGAIGVERHGADLQVQGAEITIPALSFSKTRRFPPEWLTADRIKELSRLTGTTNAGPFLGFAAGELLFEGAEGNQKNSAEPVDVSFDFIGSENVTDQTYGDITGIRKDGWEYLWFLYKEEEDTAAKEMVKRPQAAYVESVYRPSNFDAIGID